MRCPKCNAEFKPRSNSENSYYWGVVVKILGQEFGTFPDKTHDDLREKFLGYESMVDHNGVIYERLRSTTDLTTVEMEDYLRQIRMWASSEMNINIPQPNEPTEIK